MKNQVDIQRLLRIFTLIQQYGEKTSQGHQLLGLTATSDFEGYTLTISDQSVSLDLFFHNKYKFDYPNNQALETFERRLKQLEKEYA